MKDAGLDAVSYPLLDIAALTGLPDHGMPEQYAALCASLKTLDRYDLAVFVSPNAVIHCNQALVAIWPSGTEQLVWPRRLSFAVVGEGSLQALGDAGVTGLTHQIIVPSPEEPAGSESLVAALASAWDAGQRWQRVLIVRGDGGRELIAQWLRAKGVLVDYIQAYRRFEPVLSASTAAQLAELVQSGAIWLVSSSQALRHLDTQLCQISRLERPEYDTAAALPGFETAQDLQIESIRNTLPLIVSHDRIRKTAIEAGYRQVILTGPETGQLINAIHSVVPFST